MAKRPTNNTIAMKLSDAEVDALVKIADEHDEKTTTQAKACLLFGLEMSPVIELVRGLLKEEGRFGTTVRMIEPEITDEECLRWIQNLVIDGIFAERDAVASRALRWKNIVEGKSPVLEARSGQERQRALMLHGRDMAVKVIDEAVEQAMLANGWTYGEIEEMREQRNSVPPYRAAKEAEKDALRQEISDNSTLK